MNIVYFLGAGFSAPLGLPVVSNFLRMAKDLGNSQAEQYGYFREVFQQIDQLAKIKNRYYSNQEDIEEILSLLEVEPFVKKSESTRALFKKFIRDVILFYSPRFEPYLEPGLPSDWYKYAFGQDSNLNAYGYFVTALCSLSISILRGDRKLEVRSLQNVPISYSVVTTNYDCILESSLEFINKHWTVEEPVKLDLVKLHGSVDKEGNIVPPTWSKGSHPAILDEWSRALDVLSTANAIRFVGYSLPETDTYIRYLLKVAAMKAEHLREIDVINLNADGSDKKRYDEFIDFKDYRFRQGNTMGYLNNIQGVVHDKIVRNYKEINSQEVLEEVHRSATR